MTFQFLDNLESLYHGKFFIQVILFFELYYEHLFGTKS